MQSAYSIPWALTGNNLYALGSKRGTVFVAVITLIRKHDFGIRQFRMGDLCSDVIEYLTSGQCHDDGFAFTIDNGIKFGILATFCAPDMVGYISFENGEWRGLSRPVRCNGFCPSTMSFTTTSICNAI